MKYKILFILSLLVFLKTEAQYNIQNRETKFRIEVNIPTQKEKTIYLGQYWNGSTYAKDSAQLSNKGIAIFDISEKIIPGQYFLYIKPDFQIDLLIDEGQNNIEISLDDNNFSNSTVSGSSDTKLLWEYLDKTQKWNDEKYKLEEQLESPSISAQKRNKIEGQLKKIEDKSQAYTNTLVIENKNNWFGCFLKGTEPIKYPFAQPKSENEFTLNKKYGVNHFFDNVNLEDPRFWNTNYLTSYIDTYMQNWVEQYPDSLAAAASRLVAKTMGNQKCFERMLSRLTNNAIKSNRMGDENIWARLYEDYILNKNIPWIDSTQLVDLKKMYEPIKNNRIGMRAHNLTLKTMSGQTVNTNEIPSKYLILYFYDPGCGHCKTSVPSLHNELYAKYKDKGVEVVAINISSNQQAWIDFVNQHKISDWFNCADPDYKSEYWMYYNTSGVPSVYVLNENKTIIAKSIDEQNLEKLFDYYLNK
ncbi:AhpC/TSA family protein [Dysgonomonas sp. Marseille-P4677]|uniref:TlpA disulfide reductase family protein n=1 Tax=Dysgonomonas sp. Marseille-P4677 TaxID=2364790 RepID=UPI00191327A1|nr:TlpA disulfide reductase family protein [Dysgonomonas sp. Marseille-P4677]MBK5720044.1 AhpC/TSA family protein [Dysgonomonas sp. Marseille-P4677]